MNAVTDQLANRAQIGNAPGLFVIDGGIAHGHMHRINQRDHHRDDSNAICND